MRLRRRLTRSLSVTLTDNFSTFGFSTTITGTYAVLSAVQGSPGVPHIFAGAAGAVSAFVVAELLMLTFFPHPGGKPLERRRMLARMASFIAVGGGLAGAWLCGRYLQGVAAWAAGGFVGSLLFIVLDGLEMAVFSGDDAGQGGK